MHIVVSHCKAAQRSNCSCIVQWMDSQSVLGGLVMRPMIITLNLISKLTSFPFDEISKKPVRRRELPRLTSHCSVLGEKGINLSCKSVLGMVG